jgi:hypothetical protein
MSLGSLNIDIKDLPTANDYYVMFLNRSTGTIYSLSDKFTVTNTSSAANGQGVSNKPTASIVGAPNPTETWALSFDASGSVVGAAAGRFGFVRQWWVGVLGLVGASAVGLL